jgi:predicted MFS family arabinose efflux permease
MREAGARTRTEAVATLRVVLPGAAMIAVTFGLARYGYGLLLPDMQAGLGLDPRTAGLIASGAYLAYLTGNIAVVWLTARFGPRLPIALAASLAALGMAAIAAAGGPLGLAVGVLVAGSAAGLAFPPYADVVAQRVPARRRAVSWSAISSGTGWGVALAGPLAIVLGGHWRPVWLVFAGIAAVVGVVAVRAAPAHCPRTEHPLPRLRLSWFVCPRSRPLLVSAVLVGAGSSVWWAFSVDAMRVAGVAETPARIAFAGCGVAGILASATGTVTDRIGLRRCYLALCVVLTAAVALLGVAGSHLGAALISATLFGVAYNGVVAGQGLWSADVFHERPSGGLAAVNTALTLGTVTGPALAGAVIHSYGYPAALIGSAALVALASAQAPPAR